MTKQEQQNSRPESKKRPPLVSRIIRWLWVGFLSLLLAAGLFFQAPWKVTTLILIFLLAATALPRAYRKWFWAGVGCVVVALIIWVFLPDNNGDWKPYTFDKELAAIEAKRAIPDSENAAIIYNQLLASYDANVFEPNFIKKEPWSSKDCPEMAEWLQKQKDTIATLMQASQKQNCRFPLSVDIMKLNLSMDRLAPCIKQWVTLLISAANNDIAENRTGQALEKYTEVLQIANHLYQQPTMIDMLVGIATETLALKQLDRFIITGNASEEYLNSIERAVAKTGYDWNSNWPKILENERLFAKNFWAMFYEVNSKGKTRLSRNPISSIIAQSPSEEIPTLTYWLNKLIKANTILCWFYMPSTPQEAAKIIDSAYQKNYAMADPDFNWQKDRQKPPPIISLFLPSNKYNYRRMIEMIVNMSGKSYYGVHDIYLRDIADQKGSQIIIALRRYKNKNGAWPENLDEIKFLAPAETFVDPINGSSFVYKITEDNFTLYSKGGNNIDEGGKYKTSECVNFKNGWPEYKVEADDLLIWPLRQHKDKKEDPNDAQCENEDL